MSRRKSLITFVTTALVCGYIFQQYNNIPPINNKITLNPSKEHQATAINNKIYFQPNPLLLTAIPQKSPKSLADIDHNVKLQVDEDGNLIINSDTLDLFEFYLSAMGEEPLESILIRIRHNIESQLSSVAKEQAFLLLKNFVDYKIELSTLSTNQINTTIEAHSQLEALRLQKVNVASLRAKYFSPSTYHAFFQQDDQYDNFMLTQLIIKQNPELDSTQKKQQLDELFNELPDEIKRVRQSVSQHAQVFQDAQDMRNNGASKEDIYQLRAVTLGDEAAMALTKLDEKRSQWYQRLSQYAQQRDAILASGLSREDAQLAISTFIKQNFSKPESVRVQALDHTL